MFFPYLMSKWTYLKYFEILEITAILGFGPVFKLEVVPKVVSNSKIGNAIPYILRFLFDVLAQILSELWLFQNLTYFFTSWPS